MHAQTTEDVERYADLVLPFLQARPVDRNALLTLLDSLRHGTLAHRTHPVLAWARDAAGIVVGAAVCTLPYPVLLASGMSDEAVTALADAVAEAFPNLPGVNGQPAQAETFANRWHLHTGTVPRAGMAQRVYRLDEVTCRPPAPGALRQALKGDHELLARWLGDFHEQVGIPRNADPDRLVSDETAAGRLFIWDTSGGPASMADTAPPACGVVRIRSVYTPESLRGNGYARSLVAAVSQRAIDAGADCCTLSADLANPTSNSIYSQIGYRPVLDVLELRFDSTP